MTLLSLARRDARGAGGETAKSVLMYLFTN